MACNSCVAYVIALYVSLLGVVLVLLVFNLSSPGAEGAEEEGVWWTATNVLLAALDKYAFPLGQLLISFLYRLYRWFTFVNVAIFILKYVPTGLYMFKTLKTVYVTSRERIKKKQMELDDIQLQIQIVNTKLCVRDAEFTERTEQLRRNAERLRELRARVRGIIATEDALRRPLHDAAPQSADTAAGESRRFTPQEEHEFILTLLKELKSCDHEELHIPLTEVEKLASSERGPNESESNSVYSSLTDADKPECRVKIVKVTNVYKVACLKHYVRQKRIRRATQHALLKKKIEDIKKHLEGWQKSLNTVLYSRLSRPPIDLASQEAMGDYSKPNNLREFSDSDSELKTSGTDTCFDDNHNWSPNNLSYISDEPPEPPEMKEMEVIEMYEPQEYNDVNNYNQANGCHDNLHECTEVKAANVLFVLPEETSSQIAIEAVDSDCRDVVAL